MGSGRRGSRCYHNVSRLEAMILLERESKRGNLLLRPGTNGNFSVTTRQDMDGYARTLSRLAEVGPSPSEPE